jgi:hypothetical protein
MPRNACRHLDELSRATIAYAPHPEDADIVSAEGALFVGWLAAVLGLRTESVSWTRASDGSEAIVRRRVTPQPVAVRVVDGADCCVLADARV